MILERGCTPIHTFEFSYTADELETVQIVYKQNGEIILEKGKEDLAFDGTVATLQLTQAETLLFAAKGTVKVQVRWKRFTGEAEKTEVFYLTPDELLKEDEI